MKIEDIRTAPEGGPAEILLRDEDGTEVRVTLPAGAAGAGDRTQLLDDARSLLVTAADAIGAPSTPPESVPIEALDEPDGGRPLESLEEEDDNAYQDPDEALPDEREEQALAAGLTRGRFGDPA